MYTAGHWIFVDLSRLLNVNTCSFWCLDGFGKYFHQIVYVETVLKDVYVYTACVIKNIMQMSYTFPRHSAPFSIHWQQAEILQMVGNWSWNCKTWKLECSLPRAYIWIPTKKGLKCILQCSHKLSLLLTTFSLLYTSKCVLVFGVVQNCMVVYTILSSK